MNRTFSVMAIILLSCAMSFANKRPGGTGTFDQYQSYRKVIQNTASMVGQGEAQRLAQKYGLQVLNVTWEDTGRYKGSSVGPNISDMTIQVQQQDPKTQQYSLTCMPVIRYPNFSDLSADINPEHFYILVGNEKGGGLRKITLKHFLQNLRSYMSDPDSWKGRRTSLLAKRDTHVLVSAQACFLPVPKKGTAEFNPVLFNYQSYGNDPAVLTILATREGTSMTVIDNKRDGFSAGMTWGQRLFFNQNGERAPLTGKRLSDFVAEGNNGKANPNMSVEAAKQSGLNMVLLIQVPLKQKRTMRSLADEEATGCVMKSAPMCERSKSDVEAAVIGHGKAEGPFTEIAGLEIERDERFPIRVTVQFYKATSNGLVSEADLKEISDQIRKVYDHADYVGSLVVGERTNRPTEHDGPQNEPPDWWDVFWKQHQENTGLSPIDTIMMLRRLYGPNFRPRGEKGFYKQSGNLQKNKNI